MQNPPLQTQLRFQQLHSLPLAKPPYQQPAALLPLPLVLIVLPLEVQQS